MSDIESVKITQNNQTFENTDTKWISELVKQINIGEPTTKVSVNEVPNALEYVKVDFVLKNSSTSTLFVYQEKNKYYIEQPYQGIYLVKSDIIETLNNID